MKNITIESLLTYTFEGLAIGISAYIYIIFAVYLLTSISGIEPLFSLCFVLLFCTLLAFIVMLIGRNAPSILIVFDRAIFAVLGLYLVQLFCQGFAIFIENNLFPISSLIEESMLVLYAVYMFVFTGTIYCTTLYAITIHLYRTQFMNATPETRMCLLHN